MKTVLHEQNVNQSGHDRNAYFSGPEDCLKLCQSLIMGYDNEKALYKLANENGNEGEHVSIMTRLAALFNDGDKYTLVLSVSEKDGKISENKKSKTGAEIKAAIRKYGKFNPKGKLAYGGCRRTQCAVVLMAWNVEVSTQKAVVRKFKDATDRLQAAIADNVGRTIGARNYSGADIVRNVRLLAQGGVSWHKCSSIVNRPWSEIQRIKEIVSLDNVFKAGIETAICANDKLYPSLDKEILRKFRENCESGKAKTAEAVAVECKDGSSLTFAEYIADPKAGRAKFRATIKTETPAVDAKKIQQAQGTTSSAFLRDLLSEVLAGNMTGLVAKINAASDTFDKAAFSALGMK